MFCCLNILLYAIYINCYRSEISIVRVLLALNICLCLKKFFGIQIILLFLYEYIFWNIFHNWNITLSFGIFSLCLDFLLLRMFASLFGTICLVPRTIFLTKFSVIPQLFICLKHFLVKLKHFQKLHFIEHYFYLSCNSFL